MNFMTRNIHQAAVLPVKLVSGSQLYATKRMELLEAKQSQNYRGANILGNIYVENPGLQRDKSH